jgi:hypothetical protein
MKILVFVLTLSVARLATQQHAPISADEVTLRHRIYGDGRVTIFLLDIPPGQATFLHGTIGTCLRCSSMVVDTRTIQRCCARRRLVHAGRCSFPIRRLPLFRPTPSYQTSL